jgi:CheY-like chemotaxis protein
MYAEYLRYVHLTPIELADTQHAVMHAREADVIVTGIRVPGPFDGIELVRRLRADESTKRKPVIVLSACALPADQDRARAAGCTTFLSKPCPPDALAREIGALLATTLDAGTRIVTEGG